MKLRGMTAVAGTALLAVPVLAAGADAVMAARAEYTLARHVRPPQAGAAEPLVTLGAWPYRAAAASGHLDSLSVRADGVTRPGVGPVVIRFDARGVTVPEGTGPDLDTPTVHVAGARVSLYLTGDDLARALRLNTVTLSSDRDSSLAGRPEPRARITGTDPVDGREVSGRVDLVVDAGRARLVPVDEPRLALDLPPGLLPLGVPVAAVTVHSGTIVAEGTLNDREVELADLARATPGG